MDFKVEKRQKYLTPATLRLMQVFFNLIKKNPVVTPSQKQSITPFFIIGSGRCGSTLLRSVLLNHQDVHIPPESAALPSMVKKFYRYNGSDWQDLVNIMLGEFASYEAYDYWNINIDVLRKQLYSLQKEERSLAKIIEAIFILHVKEHNPGSLVWGDKTTFNTLRLNWLHLAFPNAKYVNLVRDGRDVVSSYLKSGLITNLDEAIWRWNTAVERAFDFGEKQKSKDSFMTIRYEEIVEYPDSFAGPIYNFLGLDPSKVKEEREVEKMGDIVLSHHENVKKPISSSSIGKWKSDLSPEQQERADKGMDIWLKKLGYK